MLKIKDKIKKWYDNFMIDPVFNTIMYIICTMMCILLIILFIICIKEMINIC